METKNKEKDIKEVIKIIGKRGGEKTKNLYGISHYRKMQIKSVESKKRKKQAC